MKYLVSAVLAAISVTLAIGALAQSSPPAPTTAPTTAPTAPPMTVQTNSAPAAPVAPSKRFACQTATQGLQGQDRQDQMQLCIAQARLDCLKQAIGQKIAGPERRQYIRDCVQE